MYSPRPSDRQLRTTGKGYADWLRSYVAVYLPERLPGGNDDNGANRQVPVRVTFSFWGTGADPEAERFGELLGTAEPALSRSALARTWALAQELREGTESPFEYLPACRCSIR